MAQEAEVLRCTGKWQHMNTVQPWTKPMPKRCMVCKSELIHVSGPKLVAPKNKVTETSCHFNHKN